MKEKRIIRHWGKIKSVRANAQAMHDRGVKIVDVDRILGDVVTELVGLAVRDPSLHAAARVRSLLRRRRGQPRAVTRAAIRLGSASVRSGDPIHG